MSDTTAISGAGAREAARKSPSRSPFFDHPLVQLTIVRFREFMREPEALFWVFIFPILLAAGLGIAFRNRPADVLKIVAVVPLTALFAFARIEMANAVLSAHADGLGRSNWPRPGRALWRRPRSESGRRRPTLR